MQLTIVAGARPNFMKVAPIIRECDRSGIEYRFVHTGQHYDYSMSDDFMISLGVREPDANLGVGSGSPGYQCAEVLKGFEADLVENTPVAVIVVGDVNSTLGAGLAASKLNIPLAHVEAGLRSFNREMPEEINRVVVDTLADFLFTTEASGKTNLLREGRQEDSIFFVGNTMIDSLVTVLDRIRGCDVLDRVGTGQREYCFVTIHRPSNVDSPTRLAEVLDMLGKVAKRTDVVFPVHPRTRDRIQSAGLADSLAGMGIITIEPVGYVDSLALMANARLVITDSGGIQEETTYLGVPCLTLRKETERPVTVELGTNLLVNRDCEAILNAAFEVLDGRECGGEIPPLWDGKAGQRIVQVLRDNLG